MCGGALFGITGGLLGDYWKPQNASPFWQNAYPTIGSGIGVVIGFVVVFVLIYVRNLNAAPYRQRDEARSEVDKLKQNYERAIESLTKPRLELANENR